MVSNPCYQLFTLADDYSSDCVRVVDQVEKRLMNINVYKAPGPDFIPNWILRNFAPFIAQPLTAVFNASLREGTVPEIWKSAIVIPAPKVHPPKLISSDLRPISLLPVLAKVLESFVADWLSVLVTRCILCNTHIICNDNFLAFIIPERI